ncbi:hypothetical protein BJV78DRAFT_423406 [Lactifluus subvellereus]|nr:hypothetical protein BJV78DRAFT_423406 [Lactifluus subvellereus]
MSTPSECSVFQVLFQAACKEYEIRTGTNLIEHPLAIQLQTCNSFESLISLLQGQARAFHEFRRSDRKAVVDGAGSFDGLVNLFESITVFLHRLDIYIKIPPTAAMTEIVVNTIVELLFTLALAAKQIRQGSQRESVLSNTILD